MSSYGQDRYPGQRQLWPEQRGGRTPPDILLSAVGQSGKQAEDGLRVKVMPGVPEKVLAFAVHVYLSQKYRQAKK